MRCNSGYTLLEILVAVTILGIAVTLLVTTFNSGLRSYKKGETRNLLLEQARSGLRMISADLETGLPLPDHQQFDSQSICFVSKPRQPERRLYQICYQLESKQLWRSEKLLGGEELKKEQRMMIIENIASLQFVPRIGGQWQDEQQERSEEQQKGQPDALRVQLLMSKKGEDVEFETVLFLPVLYDQKDDEQTVQ